MCVCVCVCVCTLCLKVFLFTATGREINLKSTVNTNAHNSMHEFSSFVTQKSRCIMHGSIQSQSSEHNNYRFRAPTHLGKTISGSQCI